MENSEGMQEPRLSRAQSQETPMRLGHLASSVLTHKLESGVSQQCKLTNYQMLIQQQSKQSDEVRALKFQVL